MHVNGSRSGDMVYGGVYVVVGLNGHERECRLLEGKCRSYK